MNPYLILLTFVWTMVLSACGGGGNDSPVSAVSSFTATVTGAPTEVQAAGLASATSSMTSSSSLRQQPQAVGPIPQNGLWWNPSESGRGYAIEVFGNQIIMGAYMYEPSGVATWYLSTLTQQANGVYVGALNRYSGGQTLLGSYKAPASVTAIANAALTFSSTSVGALSIQMIDSGATRTIAIERFGFSTPPFAAPQGNFQGGMWFNPDESGRGYFIEAQGDQVIIGTFMYDSNGQPIWYTTWATLKNGELVNGQLLSFSGGQSLNGNFKSATPIGSPGSIGIAITSSTTAKLTLPDGKILSISRAVVPSIDACLSVKQGFTRDIETALADAGVGGDGGSGGDGGGGAGAGGGLGKVLGGLMRVIDLSDGTFIGEAVTDPTLGMVTVKTCTRPGPFLLTLEGRAGAKYYDEGLNQLGDFAPGQTLHALVDKWDEHVGVSALTEAAYRYALNNFKSNAADIAAGRAALKETGNLVGLTMAQVQTANNLITAAVNRQTTQNYQLSSAKTLPTPLDMNSSTATLTGSRYGIAAAVTGGLTKAANYYNPSTATPGINFASDLAKDFTDGKIDGFSLDGKQVAPGVTVSYESTRMPIVSQNGISSMLARFGSNVVQTTGLRVDQISNMSTEGFDIVNTNSAATCSTFRDHAALMSDGTVWVNRQWPTNVNGLCSYTNSTEEHAKDVLTKNFLTDVKFLFGNSNSIYAVKKNGDLYGWGGNICGSMSLNLPNGIYSTPQLIPGISNVTSISQDLFSTMMRDSNGIVYIWEMQFSASSNNKSCGTYLGLPAYQRYSYIRYNGYNTSLIATYMGAYFGVSTEGDLYGFGSGTFGLLANSQGNLNNSGTLQGPVVQNPTIIPGVTGVRKIVFVGLDTVFALLNDGTVKAWGSDTQKMLGFGQQKMTPTPTTVPGLSNIKDIVANFTSMRLIKYDGTILKWNGKDDYPATGPNYSVPTAINPIEAVRYIDYIGGGLSVYFKSGLVTPDVDDAADLTAQFK